jgi:hypothetical protein
MSEEVEKRAGALTHEIPSNIPTQFDFGHTDAPVNYHKKTDAPKDSSSLLFLK